jgi:site-specific recombinase XerD
MSERLFDAAGRRRAPATVPRFQGGRAPRNKGMRYPADPPTVEELVAVMRAAGETIHGQRLRGQIVVLWRAGLRIREALALAEAGLDPRCGAVLVRRGRAAAAARSAWTSGPGAAAAMAHRRGRTPGRATVLHHHRSDPRPALVYRGRSRAVADAAAAAGIRRRALPRTSCATRAVELAHEGVPLVVIQRQLGHSNLGITSVYLQGIDNAQWSSPICGP